MLKLIKQQQFRAFSSYFLPLLPRIVPNSHPSFFSHRSSSPSISCGIGKGAKTIQLRNYASSSIADDGIFLRLRRNLGFPKTQLPKLDLKAGGTFLFVKIVDEVNYAKFFEACNMEDTFTSWFIVMELHVWLLSCRLMEDGEDGRYVRNMMLKTMWRDVDVRSRKLEGALPTARRIQIKELGEQFNTQLISYDEGLLNSDRVLAGALWRRFLQHRPPTTQEELLSQIRALELLVAYTRSHLSKFHKLSQKELIVSRNFKFEPLDTALLAV